MFGQDFYFQTIRKYVSLFGTIFSEINVTRTSPANNTVDYIRVPITYAQSEKMLTRVQEAIDGDRASESLTLPVMSFEMTTIRYDGTRKLTTTGRSAFLNVSTPSALSYQYNPVPYNIGFQLNIWVKYAEDGTKIVEQILPYFTPDFTVTVIMIPELNVKAEIPIILESIDQKNPYEGDLKKNQPIIWTLNFTIKGNFYGPIKSGPIILFSNTNLRIPADEVSAAEGVTNTGIASFTSIFPGLTANGQPTSNAALSVPANTILANSDFGYITTYGQVLQDNRYLTVDMAIYKADNGIISIDQLDKHVYIT
ncbi:MAG: tail sheath stabilizer and completion protein [Candidatus Bathyarchaeia archaeon]